QQSSVPDPAAAAVERGRLADAAARAGHRRTRPQEPRQRSRFGRSGLSAARAHVVRHARLAPRSGGIPFPWRRTAMTSRTLLPFLTLLALIAGTGPAAAAQSRAFVFTTDFSSGGLSTVDLGTRAVAPDVEPVSSDAALRWYEGN